LSKLRFVYFVVSVFSIADEINQHIFLVFLLIFHCKLNRFVHILDIFSIDVEDGGLIGFEEVRCIFGRSRVNGTGSVADLVVGDDVDGAIDVEVRSFSEAEGFADDPLGAYSCVSMDLDIQDLIVAIELLLGMGFPH
jgi:hypothetical protein